MTILKTKLSCGRILIFIIAIILLLTWSVTARAGLNESLQQLKQAYPDYIKSVNSQAITWTDDTVMPLQADKPNKSLQEKLDSPSLIDQLEQAPYVSGMPANISSYHPASDPGRIRYEPFFRKMYGTTPAEVINKLTTVYWMPKIFGKHYPLQVTTINSVDQKLARVSDELEQLVATHPEYRKYLNNPSGVFLWRPVAESNRLSPHSYGIALDLNTEYSDYWQWDLKKRGLPVSETSPIPYINRIPWPIVLVFEKNGFIWGGKWRHYDTMHFEYRPELLIPSH